jgi:tRNA/tmRNA/rRNA uracil-C5-methylase (TrmA/RlmC/RlmD family)
MQLNRTGKRSAYHYWQCRDHKAALCSNKHVFDYKKLEPIILDNVIEFAKFERPSAMYVTNASDLATAHVERGRLETAIRNLTDMLESGSKTVIERLKQREVELLAVEKRIAELSVLAAEPPPDTVEIIRDLRHQADHGTDSERFSARSQIASALRSTVDQIVCHPDRTVDVWCGSGVMVMRLNADCTVHEIRFHGGSFGMTFKDGVLSEPYRLSEPLAGAISILDTAAQIRFCEAVQAWCRR